VSVNGVVQPPDREEIRGAVAAILGISAESIPFDADLADLGIESLQLTQLINQWRRAGLTARYGELERTPTIDDWWRLLGGSVPPSAAGPS